MEEFGVWAWGVAGRNFFWMLTFDCEVEPKITCCSISWLENIIDGASVLTEKTNISS